MAQGPEAVGGVPLVVPVAAQVPVVAIVIVEDTAGVVLELLCHLHGGDDCVAVQQDVLNVPLCVVVPGDDAPIQDYFWLALISTSEEEENWENCTLSKEAYLRPPGLIAYAS